MKLSHEDIVTRMLSKSEIIDANIVNEQKTFATNPLYDLSHYLENVKNEPSRWDDKYMFVK